jgi:AcrR family transcriptional regulator
MSTEYSDTELDILTAARDLFSEKGFSATTTKEIAKNAGVNEVTLFRRFESKLKLFQAVYLHFFFEPNYAQLERCQPAGLREYLLAVGRFFHTIFVQNLNVILIGIKEHPVPETKAAIDPYLCELYANMAREISALKPCPLQEAEVFCFTFLSSLYGLHINLYVFNTFKTSLEFEPCLEKLVDAFEKSAR